MVSKKCEEHVGKIGKCLGFVVTVKLCENIFKGIDVKLFQSSFH